MVPPAPAYLGLNLFLKGTQVTPKNSNGTKKEKPKFEVKQPKSERKSSILTVRTGQNVGNKKTPILSPRSLLIDFNDCESSPKKRSLSSVTKSNTENVFKNDKAISARMHSYLALTRYPSKHSDLKDSLSGRKPIASKIPDSSRRHASCGPKLMSITPSNDDKADKATANVVENDRKNIKCIGNKCGSEIEITDTDKTTELNKLSPRKSSQDASSSRTKIKPLAAISKSAKNNPSTAATSNDYRKPLARSGLHLDRIPSKLPNHSYNSHFYAVGLSLRAWRSKYNRSKENPTLNPTRKNSLKGKIG